MAAPPPPTAQRAAPDEQKPSKMSKIYVMLFGIVAVAAFQMSMIFSSIGREATATDESGRQLLMPTKQQVASSKRTQRETMELESAEAVAAKEANEMPQNQNVNANNRNLLSSVAADLPSEKKRLRDSKSSPSSELKIDPSYIPSDTFAACVITMDDNHFWPEWLAYHFTMLPLRRLIVTLDPKATTSPDYILKRYHDAGLVNVTMWNRDEYNFDDEEMTFKVTRRFTKDYGDKVDAVELQHKIDVEIFYRRQRAFYATCLRTLQAEGHSWISTLDMDEYLVYNRVDKVDAPHRLVHEHPTFLRVLNDPDNRSSNKRLARPCVPVSRLNYGSHEEPQPNYTPDVSVYNTSDLITFRWRFHDNPIQDDMLLGKSLVDVSRIDTGDLRQSNCNCHRPVMTVCVRDDSRLENRLSPLIVNHYKGTYEQWSYRSNDGRKERSKDIYINDLDYIHDHDETARRWWPLFVDRVGEKLARHLLQDAGRVVKRNL